MQVSNEVKEAIRKVALGFHSDVVQTEYLTLYEFEEKMKKEYSRDKRGKESGSARKSDFIEGQADMFDVVESTADDEKSGSENKPKRGRPKDKFRMVCVKKRVDKKYHPPEVSGLKMLMEIEKDSEKGDIDKLVESVKSMSMDELLEFRYKLLTELSPKDDE